jgi:hypothetical protein
MMLIEAAYPKRLETPQRRVIEAEETSASTDSMTSSSRPTLCGRPASGFFEVTTGGALSVCGTMRLGRS